MAKRVKSVKAWARTEHFSGKLVLEIAPTLKIAKQEWPQANRDGRILRVLITPVVTKQKKHEAKGVGNEKR